MYSREKIIQTLRDIVKESEVIEPYVVVAQPRRDKKETAAQSFNAYGLCHVDFMGFSMGFVDIEGEKVDVARNYLIERALESGAKYLFFIGEDTVIPFNGFKKLHDTAEKNPGCMIAGVYYVKCGGPMVDVKDGVHIREANVDPGQVYEIWQAGLDCALIPVSILRDLKEKDSDIPFCVVANNIEDIPFIGEDNFFYYRVRKAGYKILVDTDVQCLHMDLANGKYTAHPSVTLDNYFTNITPTTRLTIADKKYIDRRWESRLPAGTGDNKWLAGYSIPELIKEFKNPIGLEIGTSEGYTTNYLLNNVKDLKLFGIDPYTPYTDWDGVYKESISLGEFFRQKMQSLIDEKRYEHLYMYSDDVISNNIFSDNYFDFIFIDGLHTYSQVLKDCNNYYSKVKEGGLFCGHDYKIILEVKRAVDDFAASIGKTIQFAEKDLWYFYK